MSSHSPQLGYNHNIPHRGRLYHVQTEDSGVVKAHIFTHIFYDGTIISSRKVEYQQQVAEHSTSSELDSIVIALMQESHKTMIKLLRHGDFDDKIVAVVGEHPVEDNRASFEPATPERPERRPPPQPRDVESQGPPLSPGKPGPTVDPSLSHPVYASAEARAQVRASASGHGPSRPSRGPGRIRRRAIGGIGGAGVRAGTPVPINERRDIIVGKFASEHQAQLDEDILGLLRDDVG
ncbi:MAG: hypothetical protein K0V04_25015 [Deltaproteobacteria bacterium]|nr:hypothetical protein [Deltaproteobacteria bacterium]